MESVRQNQPMEILTLGLLVLSAQLFEIAVIISYSHFIMKLEGLSFGAIF